MENIISCHGIGKVQATSTIWVKKSKSQASIAHGFVNTGAQKEKIKRLHNQ